MDLLDRDDEHEHNDGGQERDDERGDGYDKHGHFDGLCDACRTGRPHEESPYVPAEPITEAVFETEAWRQATRELIEPLTLRGLYLRQLSDQAQAAGEHRAVEALRLQIIHLKGRADRIEADLRWLALGDAEAARCLLDPNDHTFGIAYPDPFDWFPEATRWYPSAPGTGS